MKVSAATQPLNPTSPGKSSSDRVITCYKIAYRRPDFSVETVESFVDNIFPTVDSEASVDKHENLHDIFYEKYVSATTQDDREQVVQALIAELASSPLVKFEPDYENGIFFIRAAERGDLPFLQWLVACSEDTVNLFDTFMTAANRGHLECVKFLIDDKGMNPNSLVGYGAYDNHMHIKQFLDTKREELKKESPRKMVQEIGTLIEQIEQESVPTPNALQEGIQDIVKKHLADGPIEAITTSIIQILHEYSNKTTGKEQRDALLLGGIVTIMILMGLRYLEKKTSTPPNPSSFV